MKHVTYVGKIAGQSNGTPVDPDTTVPLHEFIRKVSELNEQLAEARRQLVLSRGETIIEIRQNEKNLRKIHLLKLKIKTMEIKRGRK